MKKTLYLHIGHYKTGTTALQVFLQSNNGPLRRRGLSYAKSWINHGKHSALAFSIYRAAGVTELMHGYAKDIPPQEVWTALFDEVRASNTDRVLVSTEEFMRMGAQPGAVRILRDIVGQVADEFDFRVIAYLRAPHAHLRSWYNQMVKMNAMPVPEYDVAVTQVMEPVHYDYALALQPWIDLFGSDAVTVRPYRDSLREGQAMFEDFLSIFDLRVPKNAVLPKKSVNARLDDDLLETVRLLQMAGLKGDDLDWVLQKMSKIQTVTPPGKVPFAQVADRAMTGLNEVQAWCGEGLDWDGFAEARPQPQGPMDQQVLSDFVTHLLGDVRQLRANLHKRQTQLAQRLDALEKRLDGKGNKRQ